MDSGRALQLLQIRLAGNEIIERSASDNLVFIYETRISHIKRDNLLVLPMRRLLSVAYSRGRLLNFHLSHRHYAKSTPNIRLIDPRLSVTNRRKMYSKIAPFRPPYSHRRRLLNVSVLFVRWCRLQIDKLAVTHTCAPFSFSTRVSTFLFRVISLRFEAKYFQSLCIRLQTTSLREKRSPTC